MPLDFTLLYFFIPVFFVISITPGLCMTLALTMGITIGVRNTMKMMVGELIGVLIVAGTAVIGGGAIIATFPIAFLIFKYCGEKKNFYLHHYPYGYRSYHQWNCF